MFVARAGVARPQSDDTVLGQVLRQADRTPHAVAVQDETTALTYAELVEAIEQVGISLAAHAADDGDVLALALARGTGWVVAALAAMAARIPFCPIDPALPEARQQQLQDSAQATLRIEGVPFRVSRVGGKRTGTRQLAYVAFTSGSTGAPKAVRVRHDGLLHLVAFMTAELGLAPGDIVSHGAYTGFDATIFEIFPALTVGASVAVVPDRDRSEYESFVGALARANVTAAFVPTIYAERMLAGGEAPARLRLLYTGGDALRCRPSTATPFRVLNMYGPTETTVVATAHEVTPNSELPPLIGTPIGQLQCHVVDGSGRPCAPGEAGELVVVGVAVADGYQGIDGDDRFGVWVDETGRHPAYRTGDVASWTPTGLRFLGRTDRQVQLRGMRVEPGELEVALRQHPDIEDAYVRAKTEYGQAQLFAYVMVGERRDRELLREIRRHISETLPPYMQPTGIEPIKAIPMTPAGKVDHAALEHDAAATRWTFPEEEVPREGLEQELAALIAGCLGIDQWGRLDDFALSGGTSLVAAQVAAGARDRGLCDLRAADLFAYPTLRELVKFLEEGASPSGDSALGGAGQLVTLSAGDPSVPPLFVIHGGNGEVAYMRPLFQRLQAGRPVIGLRAHGLSGAAPDRSVERMAARYIDQMQLVQQSGPYWLAGYCVGADIAHEMALQLYARGDAVARLLVLDPSQEDADTATLQDEDLLAFRRNELIEHCVAAGFDADSLDANIVGTHEPLAAALRHLGRLGPEEGPEHVDAHVGTWGATLTAIREYDKPIADVAVTIFHTPETPAPTWPSSQNVEVVPVSGTHDLIFTSAELAGHLDRLLQSH